ncbi:YqcC family protein [Pantoea ananatis]|uniref:YqcC family protein n=1 Tax=Pantoea ananas TaxID=553 RepID=UPI0023AECCA3|nr:YqcC family protein [Pantoea ananatis]
MALEHLILQRLEQVEAIMREHDLWQSVAPDDHAFTSQQPFFLDTLQPLEWLQWVLIPRVQAIIGAGQPLPKNVAIAPYFEVALTPGQPGRALLVLTLKQLDALLEDESA